MNRMPKAPHTQSAIFNTAKALLPLSSKHSPNRSKRSGSFVLFLLFALLGVMPLKACQSANAQGGLETAEIQTSAVCNTCKMTLTKAFKDVEGVKWSRLDLGNKVMTIKYDPETISLEELQAIIVKTGYDADGQTGDQVAHDALPYCCQKDSGMH